jgi:hypothetical protein
MDRDYYREAETELAQSDASRRWVRARIDAIHERITAHDVLRRFGVALRYGSDRREQFSCPFHGVDTQPSARVYPVSDRSPSHAWCFVCQERWDAITLWKKFTDFEGAFTQLLASIEKEYGLSPPEAPPSEGRKSDPERIALQELFDVCESRLQSAKSAFDMRGFLVMGSILDRLHSQVESNEVPLRKAARVLRQVLAKIAEKKSVCLGD